MHLQSHAPRSTEKSMLPGIAPNCRVFHSDGHSLGTIAAYYAFFNLDRHVVLGVAVFQIFRKELPRRVGGYAFRICDPLPAVEIRVHSHSRTIFRLNNSERCLSKSP
jgi:hypothetical protein